MVATPLDAAPWNMPIMTATDTIVYYLFRALCV